MALGKVCACVCSQLKHQKVEGGRLKVVLEVDCTQNAMVLNPVMITARTCSAMPVCVSVAHTDVLVRRQVSEHVNLRSH